MYARDAFARRLTHAHAFMMRQPVRCAPTVRTRPAPKPLDAMTFPGAVPQGRFHFIHHSHPAPPTHYKAFQLVCFIPHRTKESEDCPSMRV